eukprot:TRINITY_DN29371_c0_g1_i3.p1 TRINITY_DN29371_c0_g1~~TRINITY_DN29371_c0_g1_i3.p1  ORF type:complete len:574 (+),score=52.61 TRINITY_DN29371_c0_g1_i3:680-2401(+)
MAGAVAALTVVTAPLVLDETCHVRAWEDHEWYRSSGSSRDYLLGHFSVYRSGVPYLGEHFGGSFLGIWLVTRYCQQSKRKKLQVVQWLQRYVVSILVNTVAIVLIPWLFVACPGNQLPLIYGILEGTWYLSYLLGQACLARMSVLRLRLMRQDQAADRCGRLTMVWMAICAATLCVIPLFAIGLVPRWLATLPCVAALVFYCDFQYNVFRGLAAGANLAIKEARFSQVESKVSKQVNGVRFMTRSLALSSGTTVAVFVLTLLPASSSVWPLWLLSFTIFLDAFSDAVCALAFAGMLVSSIDSENDLRVSGELVEAARQRQVLQALTEAARAVTGPSVTLAALFEGREPEELLHAAVARFRSISWETLRQYPDLIKGGGTLDGLTAAAKLYELSEPCQLSECDAFLSHSWHDDGERKWQALTEWCTVFSDECGRPPRLWFDKVCINQTDVQNDLQCLPIFVAGCNTLLVTCGRTYTSRLWCCVELFVYMKMSEGCERDIQVCLLGGDEDEERDVADGWYNFDSRNCECFKEDDKKRILACIEKSGGADSFNEYIQGLSTILLPGHPRNNSGNGT